MEETMIVHNERFTTQADAEAFIAAASAHNPVEDYWGIWPTRKFPFNHLEEGDPVLLRVSWPGGSKLVCIVTARDVLRTAYPTRAEGRELIDSWSGGTSADDPYTDERLVDGGGYILAMRATDPRPVDGSWDVKLQRHGWGSAYRQEPANTLSATGLRELVDDFRDAITEILDEAPTGALSVPPGRTSDPGRLPALLEAAAAPEVCAMFASYAQILGLENLGEAWSLSCLPQWAGKGPERVVAGTLSIGSDSAFQITLSKLTGGIESFELRVAPSTTAPAGIRTRQDNRHTYVVGTSIEDFITVLSDEAMCEAARASVQGATSDGHRPQRHNVAFAAFLGLDALELSETPASYWEVAARYSWSMTRRRNHQGKFRRQLFASREVIACEVCGLTEVTVLEAAHIVPDADGGPSSFKNAAILCCNHHAAFDGGLMSRSESGDFIWNSGVESF